MQVHGLKKWNRYNRTLLRGVCWFASVVAIAALLTACGGGGGEIQPPPPSDASLMGNVSFDPNVPLVERQADVSTGAVTLRIVDPGDDIGGVDPGDPEVPSTFSSDGNYVFKITEDEHLAFFNLWFIVDAPLENNGFDTTPVSLNIPVSLTQGIGTLLSCHVEKPLNNTLQVTYTYDGPNGARKIRMQLDFITDLIRYDLDLDGLFDDIIAVDANHDGIPDEHAPVIIPFNYNSAIESVGTVTSTGSNSITVSGTLFEVWATTNIENSITGAALSLADLSFGRTVIMNYVTYAGSNLATTIRVQPLPTEPQGNFETVRSGVIQDLTTDTIFVGDVLFHGYQNAVIEDILGNTVNQDQLEIGKNVTVTGIRSGDVITAKKIVLKDVTPTTHYIERMGTIDEYYTVGDTSVIVVAGIPFQLSMLTLIRDLSGTVVGGEHLVVGNPVRVFGIEDTGEFFASEIELQFTIDPEPAVPEIVVLVDDASILPTVEIAINSLNTEIAITTVVVATGEETDPTCLLDAFLDLIPGSYTGTVLNGLPGLKGENPAVDPLKGVYPRVSGEGCLVLTLIEESFFDDARFIINWALPLGVGTLGTPFEFESVMIDSKYGDGPEILDAIAVADQLKALLNGEEHYLYTYASREVGLSDE